MQWNFQNDPKRSSDCLSSGTGRHQQMGCRVSWDINNSQQTRCTTGYKKLPVKIGVLFLCYSEHWALFFPQLTTDTKAFRLAIVCFSCLVNRSTKCNVPWATLNRFTVICCVQGTQVLWSLRVVFVRHDGEMKVCFAVAPSLLRERVERRWLQFACSSVAEMNGWHLWFH